MAGSGKGFDLGFDFALLNLALGQELLQEAIQELSLFAAQELSEDLRQERILFVTHSLRHEQGSPMDPDLDLGVDVDIDVGSGSPTVPNLN